MNTTTPIETGPDSSPIKMGIALLLCFALLKVAIHLVTNIWGGYGIFRDELYYIACSNHLDLGYVDQPPLSIYILALNRLLFGDSIFALRLLPALAGGATVFLTGRIARELGGNGIAQTLACIASIVSIINLGIDSIYSMNGFDILLWTSAAYVVVRLIKHDTEKEWLSLGIILGFGALNKIGSLWFGGGIFIGFLLTRHRRWLKTSRPWVAAITTLAFFLPFIVWNFMHDFAHLEFIRNATSGKYSGLTPMSFIIGQILVQNPVTFPLWLAGIFFLLFSKNGKKFRPLGISYVAVFLLLIINGHSKAEYLSPAYGMLFSAGGVAFEQWLSKPFLRWLKPVYLFVLVSGIALAPVALPILPVETYIRYAAAMGIQPSTAESKELAELPQFYADMFGWEDKAAAVAKVFYSLTPEERARCAIFADNYGRCGAIDFWASKYNLPSSIGSHNNYWIWGQRNYTGELVIILGGNLQDKQERFEYVEIAGAVQSNHCMPYENNLNIYVCRNLKTPLNNLWPQLKHYD